MSVQLARACLIVLSAAAVSALPAGAQVAQTAGHSRPDTVDLAAVQKIKAEAFQNSSVMEYAFWLTDAIGPRLTNSPLYRKAGDWVVGEMRKIGLADAKLEPFEPFGPGWENTRYEAHMLAPSYSPLIGFPLAYTAGTNGTVSGEPLLAILQTDADLERWAGKLRGRIVMVDPIKEQGLPTTAQAHRFTDAELREEVMSPEPGVTPCRAFRLGAGGGPCPPGTPADQLKHYQFLNKRAFFLAKEGAAVVLQQGTGSSTGGTVFGMLGGFVGILGGYDVSKDPLAPCTIVLTPEHYNRIVRLVDHRVPVTLEFNVASRVTENSGSFNVVGEIPGGARKDEVVMVGGHLDSWVGGTGATDDAAGAAIALEAMRILKASGLRLDRTVRIGLWAAEEQNLAGARGYVRQHFGDVKGMKTTQEHEKFSAYFNLDQGSGRIRGIYLQGNEQARPIFERWLSPFADLGATAVSIRDQSADLLAFDEIGLPSFQFLQDDLDYAARTWHSNMDVYDRLQKSDMMQAAAIVATFLYQAANRDEKLPRKPMPMAKPAPAAGR